MMRIKIILLMMFLLIPSASATVTSYGWWFPSDAQSWTSAGLCSGVSCVVTNGWNTTAPTSIWFMQSVTTNSDRTTESSRQSPSISYTNGTPTSSWLNFTYMANTTDSGGIVTPYAMIEKPDKTTMQVWSTTGITTNTGWIQANVNIPTANFSQSGNYRVLLNATLFTTNSGFTSRISWDNVFLNLTWTVPDTTFTVTLPSGETQMFFNATNKSSKNISARGQNSTSGFINVTNTGNVALSFNVNNSGILPSGVSIKVNTANNSVTATTLSVSLYKVITGLAIGGSQSIWYWADYTNALVMNNNTLLASINSSQ